MITHQIIYMIEQGIIHPASNYLGGYAVDKFDARNKIEQAQGLTEEEKKELADFMDKLDEESALTSNQLRAIKEGYRPVKLGNKLMFFNDQTGYYVDIDKLYSEVKETQKTKTKPKPPTNPKPTYNIAEQFKPSQTMKEIAKIASLEWDIAASDLEVAESHLKEVKENLINGLQTEWKEVENSGQHYFFQGLDKGYLLVIKYGSGTALYMGAEAFAKHFPGAYNKIHNYVDEKLGLAAMKVSELDDAATQKLGSKYTKTKEFAGYFLEAAKTALPKIAQDGIVAITLGGAGNVAAVGAKKLVNLSGVGKLVKPKIADDFIKAGTKADALNPAPAVKVKSAPKPAPDSLPKIIEPVHYKGTMKAEPMKVTTKVNMEAPKVDITPTTPKYEFTNSKSYLDNAKTFKPYDIHYEVTPKFEYKKSLNIISKINFISNSLSILSTYSTFKR